MKMSWRLVKGKYVVSKGDGVYIALTEDELEDMHELTGSIICGLNTYRQKDNRKPFDTCDDREKSCD